MIGIQVAPEKMHIAGEFFELFKTAWEPAKPECCYSMLLLTNWMKGDTLWNHANTIILFSSSYLPIDLELGLIPLSTKTQDVIAFEDHIIPIYKKLTAFCGPETGIPFLKNSEGVVGWMLSHKNSTIIRIGYDLFLEIESLFTEGQPSEYAVIPTLECHIEIIRTMLLSRGIAFAEILPRPPESPFFCCLTHDIDFFGIRRHFFDRTLLGFLYRSTLGACLQLLKKRRTLAQFWVAINSVLSLPYVFLNKRPDFWQPFQSYHSLEKDRKATYFLIPKKKYGGVDPSGNKTNGRGVAYEASEIKTEIQDAIQRGNEIALHGIDAWHDSKAADAEMKLISQATGHHPRGVRMHWLFFDKDSPRSLDQAGFSYDSTVGYNEAIGFRIGSAQVFRFPNTLHLLELPMIIQDTALFFPARMGLSEKAAEKQCGVIMAQLLQFGGVLTLNWHDRSLAPERLWGDFYQTLLNKLNAMNVSFASAEEVTDWFRLRRSIYWHDDNEPAFAQTGLKAQWPFVVRHYHSGEPTCNPLEKIKRSITEQIFFNI